MEQKVQSLIEKIRSAKSVAIIGHKNPDGDSFCSVLALAKLIELNFGARPLCVYDGNIPEYLDGVPLRSWIKYYERVDLTQSVDLAIIVDYGTRSNVGGAMPLLDNAKYVVEIDHHKHDEFIADLVFYDDGAAASGQIIYDIMQCAGWTLDKIVATLLAVTIITDTGNFKFVRGGDVLRVMAGLVDAGISMREIFEELRNKPRKAVLVESAVASRAEFFYRGRLAIAVVPHKDYKYLDGRGDIALNLLGQIKDVEYIALLKEQKENQTGVSLRSRGKPIDHIAVALGGGGHACAAGAVVRDSVENVRAKVIELFKGA